MPLHRRHAEEARRWLDDLRDMPGGVRVEGARFARWLVEAVEAWEQEQVQLSRAKGGRLPPGAASVARPGRWGNPLCDDWCGWVSPRSGG